MRLEESSRIGLSTPAQVTSVMRLLVIHPARFGLGREALASDPANKAKRDFLY